MNFFKVYLVSVCQVIYLLSIEKTILTCGYSYGFLLRHYGGFVE